MKISYGTRIGNFSEKNGYGYANKMMLDSLHRLGYEVNDNDSTADVEIWFDQPEHWDFTDGPYRIGYHPWESTALIRGRNPDWLTQMNSCDEIWTPSPLIANWYKDYMGIQPPVYVYEHGVDPVWAPKKRTVDGTFKFLHVGGEAARKGLRESMQALRLAFPRETDVRLNSKIISRSMNSLQLPRIKTHNQSLSLEDLIQMHYDNHVYVYPSWGEGFGLTPLQAMATGMPTITVPAWAPYERFLDSKLSIGSHLVKSPWPAIHPGFMLKPSLDDTIEAMRHAYSNYHEVEAEARARVDDIMDYYNWDKLTAKAFGDLEDRLENS